MATIALDDVVLEQMETNVLMSSLVAESRAMYFMERQGFLQLIEKQDELTKAITEQIKKESQRDREEAREGGGAAGEDGGDSEGGGDKPSPFKKSFGETAGAGMGSAVGMAASLTALGAGIAGFIGALTVAGGITKLLGIDFSGMKKMLVGVAGAFAAASTAGLIKFMIFMGAANRFLKGGNWKETAKNLGGLGLGLSGFLLALGAAGSISSLFGLDYGGLKNMMVGVSEAFASVNPLGFAIMGAALAGLIKYKVAPKQMLEAGAGIAAFLLPLAALGGVAALIGSGDGIWDLLQGLGDGLQGLATPGAILALGAVALLAYGMKEKFLMGMLVAGAGLAAFLLPISAVGAISGAMGGGEGIKNLLEGIGLGLQAIAEVDFLNLLPAGPALVGLAAGLVALTGGQLIASIGEFITKFFRGDDKTVIQRLAEDLSNFNKVDLGNLAKINDAADGIDKMAEAMDKLKDVDGEGIFAKISGAIKDFALSTPLTAPVRMVMGETPSDFTPSPAETYEAMGVEGVSVSTAPEPRTELTSEENTGAEKAAPELEPQKKEIIFEFNQREEAMDYVRQAVAEGRKVSYRDETYDDVGDDFDLDPTGRIIVTEESQPTARVAKEPDQQVERKPMTPYERKTARSKRREAQMARNDGLGVDIEGNSTAELKELRFNSIEEAKAYGKKNFPSGYRLESVVDEDGIAIPGQYTISGIIVPKYDPSKFDDLDDYYDDGSDPFDKLTSRPEKPMVDTAVTDYVEKESVASATAQSAAPVVIQDNSVNMPSQTSVNQSNIQQPPMSSPVKDNGTRVAAAYV